MFTTFWGWPARNALTFSTVQSIMRWRLLREPQDMCGVMMQFLAFSSGLSARMGAVVSTS